jgi:acyl-CoA thioester hydrolase
MPAIYEHVHVVTKEEIDAFGHVNNLSYVRWLQEAAIAHSAAQGWPTQRYRDQGAGWVVKSHFIEYLQPAFEADTIVVQTWVAGFKRISSIRKYIVRQHASRSKLAVAETNWAFVGFDPFVPRRIPAEIIDSFTIVPLEQEPRE